ncbi:MAG: MBL fold metallo-hydrolase [Burkholderiales bacterium]|jgi:glyoxylase-like metal-dependent hydrolase (beta-lactamase superfamily II)|nr:MBL fold metallo-hydrolase [Burkholderiales bacterium]
MQTRPPFIEALAHDIYVIDTGFVRPRFDASHLIVERGRAAFVDTGTNFAVPRLLQALDSLGLARDAVDFVIATHVHLDHAGGAGALLQHLPQARLVVHKLGARHLVDPSRLMASARAVYGDEEVAHSYGELVCVAPERVLETHDAMVLDLAGRALQFIDTPGHARHHHCIWDECSRGMFSGDTFGVAYPEFTSERGRWLIPATPPTQFDPDALRSSVQRILGFHPERVYLTHYGEVSPVAQLGATFHARLEQIVALGERLRLHPQRVDALRHGLADLYRAWLREHSCVLPEADAIELLRVDLDLNAQGMHQWLA